MISQSYNLNVIPGGVPTQNQRFEWSGYSYAVV